MTTAYAYSVVKYRDPNTLQQKVFKPGQPLEGVPREYVAKLLKRGAASTYDRTKSQAEQSQEAQQREEVLRDRIKNLEAQLAEKSKQQAPPQTQVPATATQKAPTSTSGQSKT